MMIQGIIAMFAKMECKWACNATIVELWSIAHLVFTHFRALSVVKLLLRQQMGKLSIIG